jgi:exodeoxyribonuclease V alpha subunit
LFHSRCTSPDGHFNGDIGQIISADLEEGILTINFDNQKIDYEFSELDEIALAYATSIHKSQGSEYPAVVIPLAMQHYRMLARNLLYTAVTRGKQLVVIVGQPKALAIAVRHIQAEKRIMQLQKRLLS